MRKKQSQKNPPLFIYQIINLKDTFINKVNLYNEIAINNIILYIYFLVKFVPLLFQRNVI